MIRRILAPAATLAALFLLAGCGCGFDCNSNSGSGPSMVSLTLGFSDESLEGLKQVVIEVDSITFRRSTGDVLVDSFTIDELSLTDADTFQVDLLRYRGRAQLLVIENLSLEAGTYSAIDISILDGDVNRSYTQESDDALKEITAPPGGLSLAGFSLSDSSEQYTVEFSLAQSLQFRSTGDDYLLASDGIRVEDTTAAASLTGRVDSSLFDTTSPCDAKTDPLSGNRVYLYEGTGLTGTLSDVFTPASPTTVPAEAIAPFAVATLLENATTENWEYVFGYVGAGDYTLAFSCDVNDDDPVNYDGYTVPLPSEQFYEITLSEGEQSTCDIGPGASCS